LIGSDCLNDNNKTFLLKKKVTDIPVAAPAWEARL
jgi:hypothetical protein